MTRNLLFTALLGAIAAASGHAAPITGVTASPSSTACCDTSIANITDGSGLSSYAPDATHAGGAQGNVWATMDANTGSLTFDLGGLHALDGLAIWNFNGNNSFSVRNLTVLGSADGTHYVAIPGAPTQLSQAPFLAGVLAEQFSLSTTAAFIRFDVESSFGAPGFGLAEVMFLGQAVPRRIPEPGSLALLLAAVAGGMATTGQRRASRHPRQRGSRQPSPLRATAMPRLTPRP